MSLLGLSGCLGFPSQSPVCAPGIMMDHRGQCTVSSNVPYYLPFREGTQVQVTQGVHGFSSHRGQLAYGVDFACHEGTPITASRGGVVLAVKKDSNRGCPSAECVNDANYVIIDHGDGTFGGYYHLQLQGALVAVGDQVCTGQLIGLCGDTGFSTGPHLHFEVANPQGDTLPIQFVEARFRPGGVLLPREHYRSENARVGYCRENDYSLIGRAAFTHRGIILRRDMPSFFAVDERIEIQGLYTGEMTHVALHRREVGTSEWSQFCVPVDPRGRFSLSLSWDDDRFAAGGQYFLMLTGSNENCSAPGWAWAYRVWLY